MSQEQHTAHKHQVGYGTYVLIWLVLLSLTVTTVAVSGINLGNFILFTALLIALIKSILVVNVFMHIKFDAPIFKVFLGVAIMTLLAVFILISFDVFFR